MRIDKLYEIFLQHPSVQTDTRKLKPGDIFFALKGENFNGNEFAAQAIAKGAAYAVVDEPLDLPEGNEKLIRVKDVLSTLQGLAKYHREQFNIPFLAITGSNGKTTTKELIHAVLSSSFRTYTTTGNLNNHIGIPLTILKIKKDAEMAVVEMGANHIGEIAGYCRYALPTHGIITNCGKAHLEGFGSIEGVRKGKGELFDFLKSNGGTAFVMWDYDYLRDMSKGIPHLFRYGTRDADLTGSLRRSEPFLEVDLNLGQDKLTVKTQLVGDYNLPNLLAAAAIGMFFQVNPKNIQAAIEQYAPSNSRSQLVSRDSNRIILDAYNANPSSMKAAIENFARIDAPNKILVLGAMAELGKDSLAEHQQILDLIGKYPWKEVVLVGGDFQKLKSPYRILKDSSEAKAWFHTQSFKDTYFLVKGSRSMQMEKVLEQPNGHPEGN